MTLIILSISLSLCDLPLFIAIDIFWSLYIIKLRLWIRKTSFHVVKYKYDTWFYSWLKCYNGIFIFVRLRIPCVFSGTPVRADNLYRVVL
jgi:hypothetical protein